MRVLCRTCRVEVNEGETCINGHLCIPDPNRFKVVMSFGNAGDPVPYAPPIRVKLFSFYKTPIPTDGPCPPGSRWDTPSPMPPRTRNYILKAPDTTSRRNGRLVEVVRGLSGDYHLHDCNACDLDANDQVGGITCKASLLPSGTFEAQCAEAERRVEKRVADGWVFLRYEDHA